MGTAETNRGKHGFSVELWRQCQPAVDHHQKHLLSGLRRNRLQYLQVTWYVAILIHHPQEATIYVKSGSWYVSIISQYPQEADINVKSV